MVEQIELSTAQQTLEELLRDALAHLYDAPQLQLHPLTRLLAHGTERRSHRVLTLHRLILEAMERLRPLVRVGTPDPAWRPYLALHQRYVEGAELQQIADELGLSLRQLRREHARGLRALALIIWRDFLTAHQQQRLASFHEPAAARKDAPDEADSIEEQDGESLQSHLDRELARLDTGQPRDTGTSLHEALQGVVTTLADLFARQAVQLHVQVADALPPVGMDRVVLRQILLNVLVHLLAQSSGGEIVLHAQADADMLPGMLPEMLEVKLRYTQFAPQAASAPPSDRLSIAEQLLSLQRGQLMWEKPEESGSDQTHNDIICRLRLPVHQSPVVLVIDDNPDLISLFQRYLADSPCRVVGITDSRNALETVQTLRPQAILLDVMMPEQDGWELLQRLRVQPECREIPVIVCSVLREETLARSLGANGFVAKPVTQQALKRVLGSILELGRSPAHTGQG